MPNPGHKPNLLLLRGLSRETRHWGNLPNLLNESQAFGKIILLDLPGNGRHHRVRSPLEISKYTDFIREEWLSFKFLGPWAIVGISLGGMVALDWASRFDDFQGAVIINSSSGRGTNIRDRLQISSWLAILRILFSTTIERREEKILALTVNQRDIAIRYRKCWTILGKQYPFRRLNFLRQLLAAARFSPKTIQECRLNFIRSSGDRLVNSACTLALYSHFGGTLSTHPTAGHDLSLEDPEWLCHKIIANLFQTDLGGIS